MSYDRIETENPLLDEIIYNCKLIITTLIVKDESRALACETKESLTNFDIYRAIVEGRISLYYFDNITKQDFHNAIPDISIRDVNTYLTNYNKIPPLRKAALLNYLSQKFLDEYEEKNDYYREICGMPRSDQNSIYLTQDDVKDIVIGIDLSQPLHRFSDTELSAVINAGLFDKIKEMYPDYTYLNYIDKGITPYNARLTEKYGILWINDEAEDVIVSKFQELYALNVRYVTRSIDDPAFKYYNPNYEKFLMMSIALNTVGDMISEFSEFFINREVFDIRTAEYFFDAYGVTFYKQIPMKYQKKLIRSLNRLIKYKGTSKDIINIIQIFGFDNINVYKYYMHKEHQQSNNAYSFPVVTENGNRYMFLGYNDFATTTGSELNEKLKFIKVPLEEAIDNYLDDSEASKDYDKFIAGGVEKLWDGDKDHHRVKQEMLDIEFNSLITQFMSISTDNAIDEVSFEITYFINMLMYYDIDPQNMTLSIPGIDSKNSKFNIFDTLVYIYALMYLYIGVPENATTIVRDPKKLANIHNFDLYADLDQLMTDMENTFSSLFIEEQETSFVEDEANYVFYTVDSLKTQIGLLSKNILTGPMGAAYISIMENVFTGANRFVTFPQGSAPTMSQIVNAYTTNKGVHDYLEAAMIKAQDIHEYNVYKRLYNALMITNLNNDLFMITKKSGKTVPAKSYVQYLKYKNARMYNIIKKISKLEDADERKEFIYEHINTACECVIDYIDSEDLMNIFIDMPIDTVDFLKIYMTKIIEFFMSYKLTIVDAQSEYYLNPEPNRFMDHVIENALYFLREPNRPSDKLVRFIVNFAVRDKMRQDDRVIVRETKTKQEDN